MGENNKTNKTAQQYETLSEYIDDAKHRKSIWGICAT